MCITVRVRLPIRAGPTGVAARAHGAGRAPRSTADITLGDLDGPCDEELRGADASTAGSTPAVSGRGGNGGAATATPGAAGVGSGNATVGGFSAVGGQGGAGGNAVATGAAGRDAAFGIARTGRRASS